MDSDCILGSRERLGYHYTAKGGLPSVLWSCVVILQGLRPAGQCTCSAIPSRPMQCCAIFAVPYTCGQQANAMLCYLQCHTHMASRPMQCCATCSAIHIWPMQCCAILQCHTHHGLWANALLYVLLCSAAAVQCYTPTASRPMQ